MVSRLHLLGNNERKPQFLGRGYTLQMCLIIERDDALIDVELGSVQSKDARRIEVKSTSSLMLS